MKLIKFLLFTILTVSICVNCSKKKSEPSEVILGSSMRIEWKEDNGTMNQIDSIILAESLPAFPRWIGSTFSDFETGEKITKRMYIKKVSSSKEIIFIVVGNNEPFKIIKRVEEM